ncbi:serine hydrolase domain-containing protein [Streptacidiphilus sp. PAMC 29251]
MIRTLRSAATAILATVLLTAVAIPSAEASSAGQNALQKQVDAVQHTGTVGVLAEVTGPRGTAYATTGQADIATGAPVRAADEFRIGSATKTFVATVVLQLAAEHRLSLDDTVAHWLPGVVSGNGNDGGRITVRDLLQHTSGLYNYAEDFPEIASSAAFEADRYTTYTPGQLVAIAMRHRPDFAPGTSWEYSDTNYILAGMIIQKASGHTWQREVLDRIIRPLGLRHTIAPGTDPSIPGAHLHGYSGFGSGPAIDVTSADMTYAGSSGAMISTTADLIRFHQALLGGRLLPAAELAEMETTVPAHAFDSLWPGARYGLGLMWMPLSCGGGVYSHGGDVPGYTTLDGTTPDGRHAALVEATGDGDTGGLATQHAMVALVDQQMCAAEPRK